ncbi:hypothetical protein Tsubulata_008252 [Turnera subulata]|uniref:DUF4283 domain-containing protein n=1 Tax=Turnera subulata TaxID=218843 RepID=A0A9Q0FA25_9ROSI|nr:hypothetical protein Tsubulata_008252 [Turnera subulata]
MASCESLPPSLTIDSSDQHRERASMALDLNRLDALLQASSHIQKSLKGKNISSSVVVPIHVPEGSSSISATVLDLPVAKVPSRKIDLGISSSGHKPEIAPPTASSTTPPWTNIVQNKMVQPLEALSASIPDESSLTRALYGGPWHIGGIPLLLRKWEAGIGPVDFSTSLIPVWVQLKKVPFELLTKEGLSYLASAIGKPSHMNQDCSKLLSSDQVTICVEVDYSKPLLDKIAVEFDGCTRSIDVSYSWKPQFCDLCNKWGHHYMACSLKKPTVQWVPKTVIDAPVTSDAAPVIEQPCQTQVPASTEVLREPTLSTSVVSETPTISLPSVSVSSTSAPVLVSKTSLLVSTEASGSTSLSLPLEQPSSVAASAIDERILSSPKQTLTGFTQEAALPPKPKPVDAWISKIPGITLVPVRHHQPSLGKILKATTVISPPNPSLFPPRPRSQYKSTAISLDPPKFKPPKT